MKEDGLESKPKNSPAVRLRLNWLPWVLPFVLASALIGSAIGGSIAMLADFDIVHGLVGGGIVLAIILPLMTELFPWQGEGIVWVTQVFVLVPIGGIFGGGVALVVGFEVIYGVIGGSMVASILPVIGWVTGLMAGLCVK